MEKIFYTDDNLPSQETLRAILRSEFGIEEDIVRGKNGKPYLKSEQIFFSLSHTKNRLFIAFSNENVGLDAEHVDRKTNFMPILKKFSAEERNCSASTQDFLRLWTKKESVIKYLGGSIAADLKKIVCKNEKAYYNGKELSHVFTELSFDGYILSIFGKRFQNVIPTIYQFTKENTL